MLILYRRAMGWTGTPPPPPFPLCAGGLSCTTSNIFSTCPWQIPPCHGLNFWTCSSSLPSVYRWLAVYARTRGGVVVLYRWPRPDEALVTFATPALARQAVSTRNNRSTVLVVELLSQTRPEKRAGYRRGKSELSGFYGGNVGCIKQQYLVW